MNLLARARLVDMDASHLEKVLNWRNREAIRSVMFNDGIISMEEHRKWFEKTAQDPRTIVKIFAFDDTPMGLVNFTDIDKRNGKCYWGFYIGDPDAPKGAGTIMGYLALNFIFGEAGIRKLCAEILRSNERSLRYHERLGFRTEGIFKEHVRKNGRYADVVAMALFQRDWLDKRREIEKWIGGLGL